jgi:hypothetical protein
MSLYSTFNIGKSNLSLYGNATISSNLQCRTLTVGSVTASTAVAASLQTSNIDTSNITFLNSNIITFAGSANRNNVLINADTTVTGVLSLSKLVAADVSIAKLAFPTLNFVTQSGGSNVIDIQSSSSTAFTCNLFNVGVDQASSFVINAQGRTGINTAAPAAYLHIQSVPPSRDPNVIMNNLFQVMSPSNSIVIDNNSRIGIGTTGGFAGLSHTLSLYGSNSGGVPPSLIGVDTNGTTPAPILAAFKNGAASVFVSAEGNVVLGNATYDPLYTLKVQGRTTTSSLVTSSIVSVGTNPINLGGSSLCNLSTLYANTCSVQGSGSFNTLFSQSTASCNLVVGSGITMNTTLAQIDTPVVLTNQQVVVAPASDLGSTTARLLIRAPTVQPQATSIAMMVVGNDTGRSSIRINCASPTFELFSTNTSVGFPKAGMSVDGSGFYVSYTSASTCNLTSQKQFQINDTTICLGNYVQIAAANTGNTYQGFMGLGLGAGVNTLPSYRLHVDGSVWVQSSTNAPASATTTPYFYINETTGNVGIQTNNPQRNLHVAGTFYAQSVETRLPVVTTSDSNLKTDLRPITDALEKVRALTGYTFTRLSSDLCPGGGRETGLIAQDVRKVLPEAVSAAGDHLGVAYGNLAGLFVEAIKAMSDKIAALEEKLSAT